MVINLLVSVFMLCNVGTCQDKLFEPLNININSTIHKIENLNCNLTTNVRINRRFQLDCFATGGPDVQVKWFMITKIIPTDVPMPARKIELYDDEYSYKLTRKSNRHYEISKDRIDRDYYLDYFQCEATSNNVTIFENIKVQIILDLYIVDIITQYGTSLRQHIYIDKPLMMKCEMKDDQKKVVKIHSLKWIFFDRNDKEISIKNMASKIKQEKENLTLDGLTLKFGNYFKVTCVAYFNETYDIIGLDLTIILEEPPQIYSIYFNQIWPITRMRLLPPLNYTYDALKMTEFECHANITGDATASISWFKCIDVMCNQTRIFTKYKSLTFYENSTEFEDIGEYRCNVILEKPYGDDITETASIYFDRFAPPINFGIINLTQKARNSLRIICLYEFHSPLGIITWSFIPLCQTDVQQIPKKATLIFRDNTRKSQLTIMRPLDIAFSGIYICNVTNLFGSGGTKFNVTIEQ